MKSGWPLDGEEGRTLTRRVPFGEAGIRVISSSLSQCGPSQPSFLLPPPPPLQDPPFRPAPPAVPLSETDPFSRALPLGLHSGNRLLSDLPPRMPPISIGQAPRIVDPALLKQLKQVRPYTLDL